jgi:hypothetical protein
VTTDPYMDPLDERLKAAMKALGDQVSDRYFEELPDRTIARLEELMQSSEVDRPASGQNQKPLPVAAKAEPRREEPKREEDSGLHDIRALAQSTKQRMSQRRIPTQNPPVDQDVLATSSASLRAVALPDPDKMVALEQPIIGNGTGSAPAIKAEKADRASAKKILDRAAEKAATASASASATALPSVPVTQLRAVAKRPSKTPMIVLGGVAAAAAAGVIGFMMIKDSKDRDATTSADTARMSGATPVEVTPIEEQAPAAPARAVAPSLEGAAMQPGPSGAAVTTSITDGLTAGDADDAVAKGRKDEDEKVERSNRHKKDDKDKDKKDDKDKDKKIAPDVKAPPPVETTKPGAKKEESLDDLLRGAGVDPDAAKKKEAPKLEKKALDAADIRKGMSALNGKAQACHAKFGVSGSVAVKLTVAPSGEVKTTKVTGSFAGTPTGDCIASVAANAKFPAWDGAPTTVNYSYFLSE